MLKNQNIKHPKHIPKITEAHLFVPEFLTRDALEAKSAQEGIIMTEAQVAALERAKEEKKAHGEIETHHPCYLGAQDTYYVGNIKGVGHIYQQTETIVLRWLTFIQPSRWASLEKMEI